jgi:hypothetical protein
MGNQSGVANQGYNSIAIGNLAGVLNQSANSIILNASGSVLDAYNPGLFVSPVATQGTGNQSSVQLLGYGADGQVVQSSPVVLSNGNVGIGNGIANPSFLLTVGNAAYPGGNTVGTTTIQTYGNINLFRNRLIFSDGVNDYNHCIYNNYGSLDNEGVFDGFKYNGYNGHWFRVGPASLGTVPTTGMFINVNGYVGIGMAGAAYNLDILGAEPTLRIRTSTAPYSSGTATLLFDSTTYGYPFGKIVGYDAQTVVQSSYYGGLQFYCNYNATIVKRMTIDHGGTIFFHAYTSGGTLNALQTTGQLTLSSDIRIKDNIVYLNDTSSALNQINHIRPATFCLIGHDGTYLGFIAQDVEKYIPLAVDGKKYEYQWEVDENGKPKFDADGNIVYLLDGNGDKIIRPRGLDDRAIIATQTLAIQELSKLLTAQNSAIASLEARLAALESK